jgi:hypothetical protein
MPYHRKIAEAVVDPTMPSTPLELDGKTYNLCFDLRAMAEAQQFFKRPTYDDKGKIIKPGNDVNLLAALPNIDLDSVMVIFPCIVHKYHPELSFEEAQALVTLATVYPIATAIGEAWRAAVPDKAEEAPAVNPPLPEPEPEIVPE